MTSRKTKAPVIDRGLAHACQKHYPALTVSLREERHGPVAS